MAKQLNVNLGFTADTSQARAQIQQLSLSLNRLTQGSINSSDLPITKELVEAQSTVAALKVSLNSAFNVQTGKLDLSKFSEGLNKAGLDLKGLQSQLERLGPEGVTAFQELATSIMAAEVPLTRSNALISELWTTLKNTARWQISSSILHGFMSSLQSAVGYAQDLNRSLNDIRIVSGQSADQMAAFAERANKAAKELSVTTNAYTKGALVYYQQGLDDQQVKERTDITMKMANVSQQSAEVVSDQLTAVWNNFAKGGENLEHFADAMVRLGADTASSSGEIAEGLEKFAAIGDTVGLSFDNAAAALATVTATTRQSADVVGTAFKTLFARIQDLELGDTLEDGTTLGKYSEALNAVGINIKTQSGDLKDMDTILNEMGNKWTTLSKDQQVALAQTVAGTRQYTQLIALMDNFDFYQENLQRAQSADGSLQEQADIYSESWQAASKRVRAAMEDIWDSILNDKFFVTLLDGFTNVLNLVGDLVDSLGGLPGVLSTVGFIFAKVFGKQLTQQLSNLAYGIRSLTGANQSQAQNLKEEAYERAKNMQYDTATDDGTARALAYDEQLALQKELQEQAQYMTEEEKKRYELLLEINQEYANQAIEAGKVSERLKEIANNTALEMRRGVIRNGGDVEEFQVGRDLVREGAAETAEADQALRKINAELQNSKTPAEYNEQIKKLQDTLNKFSGYGDITADSIRKLCNQFKKGEIDVGDFKEQINQLTTSGEFVEDQLIKMSDGFQGLVPGLEATSREIDIFIQQEIDAANANLDFENSMTGLRQHTENVKQAISGFNAAMSGFSHVIVLAFQGISQISMGIMSLSSIISVLNNQDMSFGEKFLQITMSLSMGIPSLITGISSLIKVQEKEQASVLKLLGAKGQELIQRGADVIAAGAEAVATKLSTAANEGEEKSIWQVVAAKIADLAASVPLLLVTLALVAAIGLLVGVIWVVTKAFEALSNSYHADAIAAENASKQADLMSSKYDTLTEKANKFKEAVSGYEDAVNSLKGLEQGTNEYKEALEEANNKAMALVETYGLWDSYTKKGDLIVFKEGTLENIKEEQDKKVSEAKTDSYAAKITANSARVKSEETNLQRNIGYVVGTGTYSTYQGYSVENKRQFTDEETQEVANALGDLQDAANMSDEALREALERRFQENSVLKDNIDVIIKNKEAFLNLAQSTKEAAEANKAYAKEIATELVGDTTEEKEKIKAAAKGDTELEGVITNFLGSNLATAKNEQGQTLDQALGDVNASAIQRNGVTYNIGDRSQDYAELNEVYGTNIKNYEDLTRLYAEKIVGLDPNEIKGLNFTDKNWKGTLKTAAGEEVVSQISYEEMNRALAQELETEKVKADFDNYTKDQQQKTMETAEKLVDSGELGQAVLKSLQNGVEQADFSQLYGQISNEQQKQEMMNLSSTDLMGKLNINEEDLKNLGYESADAFKKAFDDGLSGWTLEGAKAKIEENTKATLANAAEKYELDIDVLTRQQKKFQKELEKTSDDLKFNAETATEMAISNQRMNKGVDTLTDNWKKWKKALNGTDDTLQDYNEACVGVEKALRDILSLSDESFIPDDFVEKQENIDLLDQVANGSEDAVNKLGKNLLVAQIEATEVSDSIREALSNSFYDINHPEVIDEKFKTIKQNLINSVNEMQGALSSLNPGDAFTGEKATEFAENLNKFAELTQMTADQMREALKNAGVNAEIKTKAVPLTQKMQQTITEDQVETISEADPESGTPAKYRITRTPVQTKLVDVDTEVEVAQINMGEDGKSPKITKASRGNISPSVTNAGKNNGGKKNGGKKNNKPTKVEPTKKKDVKDEVERYHEINEELDDLKNNLSEIQDIKDELWGADKIAQMEKERKELGKITEAHKRYQQQIAKNLNDDQWEAAQVGAIIDPNTGRITNYEALQKQWMDEWNSESDRLDKWEQSINDREAAEKNAEDEKTQDALTDERQQLSDARKANDEKYEKNRKAIEQYEDTLNLSEEAKAQLEDYFRQMRQLNAEELQYKLEIRVELNERNIKNIEHRLERLGDDASKITAERIALIGREASLYSKIVVEVKDNLAEAGRLYQLTLDGDKVNGISQSDYIERIEEATDKVLEAESSIREGLSQVTEELNNAFDLADEKVDKHYDKMDNLVDLMDHYKEVISLTKGENAFLDFNKILQAQQKVVQENIRTVGQERAYWNNLLQDLNNQLNQTTDEETRKQLEKNIEAVEEKLNDADSKLREQLQQLGQYAQEIFENAIEEAAKKFEQNLFNRPLSSIIDSIEMINSRQSELLTTTNKIYETNKLIRTVEKDMDATSNKRAKQAYQEFVNKVKQKQEQAKLTQFELDLLNAEYEITKAQIALEEAQNAKDTVRLTRDSEGNFGYVYTANEDKISSAQQTLEDAQNNYYNVALDGVQKYQDQYYQHIQEWEEKLKETVSDQTLSEEEKNKKIKEINDTYHTMLLQDEELFNTAKKALRTSAYEHQVDYDLKGIESSKEVFTNMNTFLNDLKTAQNDYETNTKEVSEKTEEYYGNMEKAIDDTNDKAKDLTDQALKEMKPAFETDLVNAIDEATKAWQRYELELREVIKLSNDMMKNEHDTKLKEIYKEDYAAELKNRIAAGDSYSDYDVQKLLEYRWNKIGGKDDTNYQELIDSGQYSGTDLILLQWLRQFKLEQTDQSASGVDYADKMIDEKLSQNYAQLIEDYIQSKYPYGRWTDTQIQKYLSERQIKIDKYGLADQYGSNEDLRKEMKEKYPEAFLDTGGYTGAWGPEGKLAVLHEKELVLNAQDTENILSSVNILRQISQALDNNAVWASLGLGGFNAASIGTLADQTLQQEVHISADFPNVTDHNEIEMAIDNLINAASQYAYRK